MDREVCPPAETRIRCSPALDIVLVSRLTLFQAAKSRYIAFGLGSLCSGRYHLCFQINKTLWRRFLILPERMIVITKQTLYLTVKYELRLRSPAIVSFRWAFFSSCWDIFLRWSYQKSSPWRELECWWICFVPSYSSGWGWDLAVFSSCALLKFWLMDLHAFCPSRKGSQFVYLSDDSPDWECGKEIASCYFGVTWS